MIDRVLVCFGLVASLLAVAAPTSLAQAVPATGRVTLTDPVQVFSGRVDDGTEIAIGSGVLHIRVYSSDTFGTSSVHECGFQPSPDDPSVIFVPEVAGVIRVVRSDSACVYIDAAAHVSITRLGTVSASPTAASQFIAVAKSTPLFDGVVSSGIGPERFDLGRPAQLPADANAAVVSVQTAGRGNGVVIHACSSEPLGVDLGTLETLPYIVAFPRLGADDSLCLTANNWAGTRAPLGVHVDLLGYMSSTGPDPTSLPPMYSLANGITGEPGFEPINPVRALDTRIRNRIGCVVVNGICTRPSAIAARTTMRLDLELYITPFTSAVSLNLAAVGPDQDGYLTVWPCSEPRPETSSLNFRRWQTRANLAVAMLAEDGTVCLWSSSQTSLIADVTGTYEFGGGAPAEPIAPQRMLDTRSALGVPSRAKVSGGAVVTLQVAGRGDVPVGADAATINITAVEADSAGYLTAWPCDQARPEASNLNFDAGATVPNLATVQLSVAGTLCIYSSAAVHLLGDVATWYGDSGSAGLVELAPARLLDTRNGIGAPVGPLQRHGVIALQVAGRADVRTDATAVVVNITATGTSAAGYATVWPCDAARPEVSNLNFVVGDTVPNLVTVKLSAAGTVCIFADQTTHVLADVAGFFTQQPTFGVFPLLA